MTLRTIKINDTGDRQYITLAAVEGEQLLTIVIGYLEVQAIKRGIDDIKAERPLTHDLLDALISASECTLERVSITELRDGTFYALIRLLRSNGEVVEIDSRPSDAIAIAAMRKAPIFVHEDVLAEASTPE